MRFSALLCLVRPRLPEGGARGLAVSPVVSASPTAAKVRGQQRLRFDLDRQHRGVGHRQTEQIAHQLTGARQRQHVVVGQLHHRRLAVRSVLHRRLHRRGNLLELRLFFASRPCSAATVSRQRDDARPQVPDQGVFLGRA
jgi:hypothetical protein